MSLKSTASKILAKKVVRDIRKWSTSPKKTQKKVFRSLIKKASSTRFGRDHDFSNIRSHADYVQRVPIRDYEGLRRYIDEMVEGKTDILWPDKPLYIAKTSGTTSGVKYIPLTKESLPYHTQAARNAILCYIHETGNSAFVDGKMIFLQGSPELAEKNGIKVGRLSGIVAHYVPKYLQKNRLPSWKTNCIADWEQKVDAIVAETRDEDMTVISGIPSWVQMYFEKLKKASGKHVGDLFKNFSLFIYGGVNYEPYRAKFEALIGRKVDSIELYPASEGFFAFQDKQQESGMLLLLDSGIFYEFVEADRFFEENPPRLTISEVATGVNYVMIISTNAGLWAYNLGDTVQFTSTKPYRVIVSGRIKHFISAFGEHVIGKEVEEAMQTTMEEHGFLISEFTVAPQTTVAEGELPYHEWLIEFESPPKEMTKVETTLDNALQQQNSYYADLIQGKVLQRLKITILKRHSFTNLMKEKGKLGGQNKIPRLANDREIADALHRLQA
ncbi:GH3 auxin-responsive promoter family protein [Constantimarinum furrinae]|uniref:GH3 auxin-responsive promoter-binding protein n=1 Tax=Constantimarinum furrinae TaxID=2562285 RepID=A0A7G8PT21_9FLAO|nr:GH3 auxin-responsive promoter family protein [Constantimarinum furrinae]QNJ97487.1 GH3 auxin-responsive promoter-binding protein [Constantimarinum furrinae]